MEDVATLALSVATLLEGTAIEKIAGRTASERELVEGVLVGHAIDGAPVGAQLAA